MQVEGRRGDFFFGFKKQRVLDRKVIAETKKIQIENVIVKEDRGYITNEQAVQEIESLNDPLQLD